MPKTHTTPKKSPFKRPHLGYFLLGSTVGILVFAAFFISQFERTYEYRVYPGVSIAHVPFSGATFEEVAAYWQSKNESFQHLTFTFTHENKVATLSGAQLDLGFDATLSATQAKSLGRSGNVLSRWYQKYQLLTDGIDLTPYFRWNTESLTNTLDALATQIDIEPENALFEFQNGRVTAFKLAKSGRFLDKAAVSRSFQDQLELLGEKTQVGGQIVFELPVVAKEPPINTDQANNLGVTELIGSGESSFRGSIAGRVHNVALAASRINGTLIPPGDTFSFNQALGDISAATGYKQAYVIKQGRTVLDDGGGVCQVSTTLFRSALNSGLPVLERHAHSYRVAYYEQGGWKPGFDATVYAPSYDLKIKNDTPAHILIQATTDTKKYFLKFDLYGKRDGRTVEISPVKLWDSRPAPPDLYQDDPTLPTGQVKQVDWANTGVKATFDYAVKRGDEEVFKKTFFSNFVPWQAVYLRGTGPAQ